jgi:hypothetical protein
MRRMMIGAGVAFVVAAALSFAAPASATTPAKAPGIHTQSEATDVSAQRRRYRYSRRYYRPYYYAPQPYYYAPRPYYRPYYRPPGLYFGFGF